MSRPLLVVPACAPGLGGGHLVRCAALARELRGMGREAAIFLPDGADGAKAFLADARFDPAWIVAEDGLRGKDWACVILDLCRTSPEEFRRWSGLAPVVAVDEGGARRDRFDFLVDVLPNVGRVRPNVFDPSLLPLPKKFNPRDGAFVEPIKALVGFGQEDAAGLGPAVARGLAGKAGESLKVTLLIGALGAAKSEIGDFGRGVEVLEKLPNLGERLREYDLVITHFGLTAFEALYAGVPALLLSPTAHHEKTARKAGFFSLGVGKGGAKKLARLLTKNGGVNRAFLLRLKTRCAALAARHNVNRAPRRSLAELANGFAPDVTKNCAACGEALRSPPVARFAERSYRRCGRCGAMTMNRIAPPPFEYDREYFFGFYQRQYGKTYVEDFPHLTAMAKRRLALIKRLLPVKPGEGAAPCLLDIGCAYGPFLAAALDEGFSPRGVEPAEDAADYATRTFGVPVERGFFKKGVFGAGQFDAVTLWLVIEHFRDAAEALAEIRAILKPGGALAFSTPSFAGISGRRSPRRFLERSPADHWTVWSPAACKKALALAGFKLKKIAVTGHHPERFPFFGKYARDEKSPLRRFLLAIGKFFALGDTFEAYAVRADDAPRKRRKSQRGKRP